MSNPATIRSLEMIEATIGIMECQLMQLKSEAAKLRNCLPAAFTGETSKGSYQPVSDAEIAGVLGKRQRVLSKRKSRTL